MDGAGIFSSALTQANGPPRTIAIIGGGATGSITAMMLAAAGFGPITLIESEARVLSGLGTTLNGVGTNHHLAWGGDPVTMEHFFKCSLLFREIMPAHVFADTCINYYMPGRTPDGGPNSAVDGMIAAAGEAKGPSPKDPRVSWAANVAVLEALYCECVHELGKEAVFGPIDEFVQILGEEDLVRMIGGEPPMANNGRWLVEQADSDGFVAAVQVKQNVVNNGWLCTHLVQQLEAWRRKGVVRILTDQRVLEVNDNGAEFEVVIEHHGERRRLAFGNVINAGYGGGIGVGVAGTEDDGLHAALKIFGLYELPPHLVDSFRSFIMFRGQFGSAVRNGPRMVAICSGKEFDRDTITFGAGAIAGRSLPTSWSGLNDPDHRLEILGGEDAALLERIQSDIAHWVPVVATFRPITLKAAPQLYPRARATAGDLEAANRRESELCDLHQNRAGGRYFRLLAPKMTGIPFAAAQAALALLEPYLESAAGALSRDQVAAHIRIEAGYVELSETFKELLGRDEGAAALDSARHIIADRYNVPMQYLS